MIASELAGLARTGIRAECPPAALGVEERAALRWSGITEIYLAE